MSKHYLAKQMTRIALKLHNFSYQLAGKFSLSLEPNKLHPKHRLTDYHLWFIQQLKPDWHVLDVGCGNGFLTADLAKHCKYIIGIDISAGNIKLAKINSGIEFICGDATTYLFNRTFDAIVLSNVLEHINHRKIFLKRLAQHTDRFLIRVPMIDRDWITLYKKELGVNYKLDPGHFIEYTFDGFTEELQSAGLKVKSHRIRYGEIYALAIKEP